MSSADKLLRQHYGLDQPNKEQEAKDIDSPNFDAKAFFEDKVKNDTLTQLLARENSLVTDIRAFDNDLQTLVYDNYSKFLGASDTVHSLSGHIVTLTEQMDRLKSSLTGVAQHNDQISADLESNRQKIQRLVGISRLLERVEFISKLPARLRSYLKNDQYSDAVNIWCKVERILSTQQHFPSFQRIHEECISIMDEVKARVRGQMLNTDVSVTDSITYAILLVKLGTPLSIVCSQLAHHRFLIIDNTLEYETIPEEPFSALSTLKSIVIDDASQFVQQYNDRLMPLSSNFDGPAKLKGILSDFMNNSFERIIQLTPCESLFTLDCKKIASYISLFIDLMKTISNEQQISKYLHKLLQKYTEARTMNVFNELLKIINVNNGKELYTNLTTYFSTSTHQLINEHQILAMMEHQESLHFLVQQFSLMIEKLFDEFKKADPSKLLILAMISFSFIEKEIPEIFEQLSTIETESPLRSLQERLIIDCKNIANVCLHKYVNNCRKETDKIIINGFYGIKWNYIDEKPTKESTFIKEFINKINDLTKEINDLFDLTKNNNSNDINNIDVNLRKSNAILKSSSFYSNVTTPTFFGIREEGIHQIDRLFTSVNRLKLSRELQFDVQQIVEAIVMYSMKTFMELIRLMCFTSDGFNQIQVDGYYIYYAFNDVISQQELFAALIEEIVSSAADRTVEPSPLDVGMIKVMHLKSQHNDSILNDK
ncbi:vacuolar protein sorting-associated protein 51 [Histomonas meleagridis]|uniref:vacuolar protein sorting-associated protein 51-like n=1 Tax=Histomonas meleagridis TaxID=135588 RepID=UPI00355A5DD7|nr:vacuolar protein sorting-associated protein 51 [Histomonas meleagridis]KAH0806682.1 vacuolar protein sorting-associated protein 51-like [Histomonas meleagridis]